ncbi:MAG: hypothetical protein JKY23_03470 [Nitrospinaceae bacterium]|nr:hypothetical protein [Nitrospinaceae bacterium]
MNTPHDIRNLIDCWSSIAAFQEDMGCNYEAARQMRYRNSISPAHWGKVIEIAARSGVEGVTLEWLTALREDVPRGSASTAA